MSSQERIAGTRSSVTADPTVAERETDGLHCLWRPGEPFLVEAVNAVLGTDAEAFEHPSFGKGYVWRLGNEGDPPVHVQVHPDDRLVRLQFIAGTFDPQSREYTVDRIAAGYQPKHAQAVLSIECNANRRRTRVNIFTNGAVEELHNVVDAASLKELTDASPSATVTIAEAAEILGCHPTNVAYLIRRRKLPAVKRGLQWFLDRNAVEHYVGTNQRQRRKSQQIP
ncbi:helix-turn-helix domain-containing protein [Candidatus Curtissbacteria bacterium]|nr:helix-turn-helix domain-containing protein [Candidatus Curtissbacteria bacterium]